MTLADRNPVSPPPAPSATDRGVMPTMGGIVACVAAEVAGPLTTALDRVLALASSGRIDRTGLQALCGEIDGARRVGLRGQQIVRFAHGLGQQRVEPLDLAAQLRSVLAEQARQAGVEPMAGRQTLAPAEVMGDASLVHTLLQATADWSLALASAGVEWQLDVNPWPVQARVRCRFMHRPADLASPADSRAAPTKCCRRCAPRWRRPRRPWC